MTTLSNLAALRTFPYTVGNEIIFIQGYSSLNDGGQGDFFWDSASVEPDNDGTIIKVSTVATGRWIRSYSGWINVKWFGAKGNGINDDTSAFQNVMDYCAKIAGTIYIPASATSYMITSLNLKSGVSIIGDSDKVVITALPSSASGLFVLNSAPLANVVYKNFRLMPNASNTAQHGIYFLAIPQTIPSYTGGVWYSVFENIAIHGFSASQIYLKALDPISPTGDLANQFLTFQNVRCFGAASSTSRALYAEGQLGQVNFLNCQFDCQQSLPNTINIELRSLTTGNDQIFGAINFIGCTSQTAELGILTYFTQNINLSGCWFENLKMGIKATGSSRIKLDGCHFASVGSNAGTGYLVNNENSYVIFINNHTIGTHDNDLISAVNSTNGWDIRGNYFGSTGDFKSNSVTKQLAIDVNGAINAQYFRDILLNNSTIAFKTITSSLSTAEEVSIRSYEAGIPNSYLKIIEGGNISLPARFSGSLILRKNDVATFLKVDLAGKWVLKSLNIENRVAATIPTTGTWFKGEMIYNTNVAIGQKLGWICIADGTPGSWKPFGYVGEQNNGIHHTDGDGSSITFVIPHNLSSTPSYFAVTAASTDAQNIAYVTADPTNLTVVYNTAPLTGTNNLSYSFFASE